MVLLQNVAFNESISSTENPKWLSEKDTSLNVTNHFRGYIVYTLHRNINITIPANCRPTFPWIAVVSTFSVLWAPKWNRAEEAHSVSVRLRLHGGHHTSFVRPKDKQDRCSAVDDAQQGRHQHRKWKEEAADDSWLQRHQGRSGYLWQDGQVLHVRKVNQTVANETFLLPRGCSLSECFRCLWFMTNPEWKRKESHKRRSFVCRCVRQDEANDWLPVAVSQHLTHANCLQGYAGDRCKTSRIDVRANWQQETWSMPELPTISGTEGSASLHCTECQQFVCGKDGKKTIVYNCVICPLRLQSDREWHSRWWVNKKHLIVLLRFAKNVVFFIIEPLCSDSRQYGKAPWNYLSSCPVTWHIIISVCQTPYLFPVTYCTTSGDIIVSAIEKLNLENMAIAVGILFIDATEFEIHVGG